MLLFRFDFAPLVGVGSFRTNFPSGPLCCLVPVVFFVAPAFFDVVVVFDTFVFFIVVALDMNRPVAVLGGKLGPGSLPLLLPRDLADLDARCFFLVMAYLFADFASLVDLGLVTDFCVVDLLAFALVFVGAGVGLVSSPSASLPCASAALFGSVRTPSIGRPACARAQEGAIP